ncbi:MAG: hypothetical protein IPM48_13640 [Saprospiraceae bacterium]|nr:hypothetical protein [Saprospiraceae bacterium]
MTESKIYHFVSSLSSVQLNRLSRYLESPYFNRNEKLLTIYYRIEQHLKQNVKSKLDKKEIWNQIYPNVPFRDEKFRKHCSELLDLGEAFLAQQVYDEVGLYQANFLLQAVHRLQIERLYNSSQSKAEILLKHQSDRNPAYYYYRYEIEKNLYKLNNLEASRANKTSLGKINLDQIVNNLDYFYIAEKLKHYCNLLTWNLVFAMDTKLLFIEEIISIARNEEFKEIPPIAVYLKIYETFVYPDDIRYYHELESLIDKHLKNFPKDEAKEIIEAAINYNIRNSNKGIEFQKQLFEIYKKALDEELLIVNDELSPWTFKNIITVSLRLKEISWTEGFIKDFADKLNPSFRENSVLFNTALIHYHKKEYGKVIPLLQKVAYEEIFYGLDSKAILISTYFELDEDYALSSLLDSFKNFLTRNKDVSIEKKNAYLNLVKYTKKILEGELLSNDQLIKIKNNILSERIVGKDWLLEKIDELMYTNSTKPRKIKK